MARAKTTMYLDHDLADRAARVLGAPNRTEAVEAALRQVVAQAADRELTRLIAESRLGTMSDAELDEVRRGGWR